MKVQATSHRKLILWSAPSPEVMYISGRNDTPSSRQPKVILVTEFGSVPRRDCLCHSMFTKGVSKTMNIGLTAWNHVDGISNPKMCQSVLRSANNCIVL